MTIKKVFNLSVVLILGFILSGCANSQFAKKYNKPFKHNTPLIKSNDITKAGKSEISKTLDMGPKPIEGDTKKLGKRKMRPGMDVGVIIKTGARTLRTELLHPLTRRVAVSMKEE